VGKKNNKLVLTYLKIVFVRLLKEGVSIMNTPSFVK